MTIIDDTDSPAIEIVYQGYRKWQMEIKGHLTCVSYAEFKRICQYLAELAPLLESNNEDNSLRDGKDQ